jgi:probable phosphoglycerate mutase
MTRIALLRHAETQWNVARRIQGRGDSPLTGEGERAARVWSHALESHGFRALYASPLPRAMRTARVLGERLGLEPVPEPGLIEQDFGPWEGENVEALRARGVLGPVEALGWAFAAPGCEDRAAVLGRAWDTLLRLAARHEGRGVLAVTHEGVIRAVLYALMGRDYLPCEPKVLTPRALHVLRAEKGCLKLDAWNLTP